jgi:dipeptidyl-peptidase-4
VVASAPTSWQYYDTIYTERYMGTPPRSGWLRRTDLIVAKAGQLQAVLIIHGLNDTSIHLQNSINLIQELEHLDKLFYFLPLPNLNHSYKGDGLVTALTASVEYFVSYSWQFRIRIVFHRQDVGHLPYTIENRSQRRMFSQKTFS